MWTAALRWKVFAAINLLEKCERKREGEVLIRDHMYADMGCSKWRDAGRIC